MSLAERSAAEPTEPALAVLRTDGPSARRRRMFVAQPTLAIVFFALMMFPSGARFKVGPLLLSPLRVFLLAIFVPVVFTMITRHRWKTYDALMVFSIGWFVMCVIMNYGAFKGIQFGGLYALQMFGSYALAQVALKRPEQVPVLFQTVIAVLAIMLPFALHESLTGDRVIHDVIGGLFGVYERIQGDQRLGLFRAATSFAHPILFGVFAAAAFSFAWYMPGPPMLRYLRTAVVFASTFLSLSAGAALPLVMQVGLIAAESQTRWLKGRAKLLIWSLLGLYVFLELTANSGAFGVLANYFTFNPWNAYVRGAIWDAGIADVMRHPVFGFVAEQWTRPHWLTSASVDNQWLVLMMRGGFPSAAAMLLAIVLILREMMRRPDAALPPILVKIRRASLYSMIAIIFAGTTVAFFDKLEPIFGFYIGLAAAIVRMQEELPEQGTPAAAGPGRRGARKATTPGTTPGKTPKRIDFWSHGSELAGTGHALDASAPRGRPSPLNPPPRQKAKVPPKG